MLQEQIVPKILVVYNKDLLLPHATQSLKVSWGLAPHSSL